MLANRQPVQDYSNRIQDVMRYIGEHIHEPLDRETLASVAGFSIPHFHRVFRAHVGESAISYVRRVRLERAARKLRMGAVDITEVALAAGYDSHAAFSKAFKQQFEVSPREFRQLGCPATTQLLRKGRIR
ncbi:MAG TPA: AraC family transcriptional regulator [Anaerolineales bacterium]|nr:AraC family transcriptional regulator [Anaerolineales bacterium]